MKMQTASKILVYDDECPLCQWYTGLFVKYKLLEPQGRLEFSKIEPAMLSLLDADRGRNEIPLLDTQSGKVLYGIDALLDILGGKMPWVPAIGHLRPVKWFLLKLYKLISYNRKVIVATRCGKGKFDCAPEFNTFYRLVFMILFFAFNTIMLIPIQNYVLASVSFYHLSAAQLQYAHLALVGVNCMLALFLNQRMSIEYLGQVNMLALVTILLIVPLIFVNTIFNTGELFNVVYLGALFLFVVKEYFRRMHYAGILSSKQFIAAINLACIGAFVMYLFV
jgi:predicted DCC family thiol-disulfide oxidoreductase YuxK